MHVLFANTGVQTVCVALRGESRYSTAQIGYGCRRKLDSAAVILRGLLVVGADDGYVFGIRLGEERGTNEWNHAAEDGYAGGFVNSSPAISEDGRILVIPAVGETLYGFSPTGASAWSTTMPA